jgi:hypothetical protein
MTFTEEALLEGIAEGSFLEVAALSSGRRAVWMGDHWMEIARA